MSIIRYIHFIFSIVFILTVNITHGQSPVIKLDMDMSGRTLAEVSDPDYVSWVPDNANTTTKTTNGVTFTLTRKGSNGTALKADWYKAGVQSPNFARLVCDGIMVDGGTAGAEIELKITGLSAGTHSILTYHNTFSDPATSTFSPIDVTVNGTLIHNNLATSNRSLTVANTASSYVTFTVVSGATVTISYKAETTSTANNKNVWINAIELNTPNIKDQAKNPFPAHKDEHVQLTNNNVILSWTKASNAANHRIYFGTDETCVKSGTTTSSLLFRNTNNHHLCYQ